jgi:putative flippase GtrA
VTYPTSRGEWTPPDNLSHVGEGWHRLLTEIGRFMAVGGIATFASFLVFNFLVHGLYMTSDPWLNGHPVTAFVIASFVGMVINYRLSRSWTFKHRPPQHADGGRTAFFIINVATMTIPMECLWISRNILGLDDPLSDNLAALVIGQLLGQVVRFYLFRKYVFQQPVHLDLPTFMHWDGGDEEAEISHPAAGSDARDSSTSGLARPGGPGAGAG